MARPLPHKLWRRTGLSAALCLNFFPVILAKARISLPTLKKGRFQLSLE
jgi:hypothetical protein